MLKWRGGSNNQEKPSSTPQQSSSPTSSEQSSSLQSSSVTNNSLSSNSTSESSTISSLSSQPSSSGGNSSIAGGESPLSMEELEALHTFSLPTFEELNEKLAQFDFGGDDGEDNSIEGTWLFYSKGVRTTSTPTGENSKFIETQIVPLQVFLAHIRTNTEGNLLVTECTYNPRTDNDGTGDFSRVSIWQVDQDSLTLKWQDLLDIQFDAAGGFAGDQILSGSLAVDTTVRDEALQKTVDVDILGNKELNFVTNYNLIKVVSDSTSSESSYALNLTMKARKISPDVKANMGSINVDGTSKPIRCFSYSGWYYESAGVSGQQFTQINREFVAQYGFTGFTDDGFPYSESSGIEESVHFSHSTKIEQHDFINSATPVSFETHARASRYREQRSKHEYSQTLDPNIYTTLSGTLDFNSIFDVYDDRDMLSSSGTVEFQIAQ